MKRICTDRGFNRETRYAPRPMTQSERARLQPRDERGQFTAYTDERAGQDGVRRVHLFRGSQVEKGDVPARDSTTDLIVVDESNSFSSMGDGPRKNLTVVCSRVGDRRSFDKIAGTIPMKNGQRTKYSNTKEPALTRIVRGIANQDISIVERHARIDSKDLDDPSDKKRLYMEVLSKSIQDAIDLDRSKPVDIILDTPPLKINGELVGLGSRLSEEYGVRWFTTKRSASRLFFPFPVLRQLTRHARDFRKAGKVFPHIATTFILKHSLNSFCFNHLVCLFCFLFKSFLKSD